MPEKTVKTPNKFTYTSGFGIAKDTDFHIRIHYPEIEETDTLVLQTKEDYEELPVRIRLVSTAEELPSPTRLPDDYDGSVSLGVAVGRDVENHPGEAVTTEVTFQVVADGELIGEDTVNLFG